MPFPFQNSGDINFWELFQPESDRFQVGTVLKETLLFEQNGENEDVDHFERYQKNISRKQESGY